MSLLSSKPHTRVALQLAVMFALVFMTIPAYCTGISVGNGASFQLGSANIDVNCLDLITAGQVALGDGQITGINHVSIENPGEISGDTGKLFFAGDWWNAGVFTAAQSSINSQDGCGLDESLIIGDNDFFNFSVVTSIGKTLSIEAGSLQTFAGSLSLQGLNSGQQLKIRSAESGQSVLFRLSAQGTQDIYAVDVKDNDATGGQLMVPGSPAEFASFNSGNNKNWFDLIIDLIFEDSFESN